MPNVRSRVAWLPRCVVAGAGKLPKALDGPELRYCGPSDLQLTLTPNMELDLVLERLHQHGQRATYGAVGPVVGRLPLAVMQGLPRNPRNSWVVAKESGLPSGYLTEEVDKRLSFSANPIETPEALRQWLEQNA